LLSKIIYKFKGDNGFVKEVYGLLSAAADYLFSWQGLF